MINFPAERFENLTPDEIKSLPTLDEAFDDILREEYNVIRKYEENPGANPMLLFKPEYRNSLHPDMFFVTRLTSRDPQHPLKYALKPNLNERAFLFRGQSICKNPSLTSALRKDGRYVSENVRYNEFIRALFTHPLVRLFWDGIELCGEKYFFEVNFHGLAQHYELKTFVMDMTCDVEAAKFFAVTEYRDGGYQPVFDENRYGMVYYYDSIRSPYAFQIDPNGNQMSSIGLQAFPRSGCQKGFLYSMHKGDNLNKCMGMKWRLFRQDAAITKRVYDAAMGGSIYFPEDELSSLAGRIRNAKVLPWEPFELNLEENPNDDRETNVKLCGDEGLTFSSVAPHIDFTEEEKSIFRNRIANGFWQDFCSMIVFPKHHERLMEELLRVSEREEYKKYFEWE